jgi:hypothetical protein
MTCGTPGAALSQEVGAGAAGTRGAPGAALSREAGGGSRSRGDMWHPRSCHAPGGRYHSIAPSSAPFRGWLRHGAIPIRPPLLLPRRHPTWVAAPSTTSTTTTTSTSATSASKGYNLHMVLTGFYSSHSICVSSSDSTFDLFSSLTICGAPAVTVGGGMLEYIW